MTTFQGGPVYAKRRPGLRLPRSAMGGAFRFFGRAHSICEAFVRQALNGAAALAMMRDALGAQMIPRVLLCAAALVAFADGAANALTAKQLKEECADVFATSNRAPSPQSVVKATACLSYFQGFVGAFDAASVSLAATMKGAGRPIDTKTAQRMLLLCIPDRSVTPTTMASIFLDWVKRNEARQNDVAQYGVFMALAAVYPCR